MKHLKRPNRLSGGYPPDRNLPSLDPFEQLLVAWRHRISPQPEFTNFKVLDHAKQPVHVIVMGVRQHDRIEPANTTRKQVGGNHVFSDRKGTFVAQVEKAAG